MELMVKQGYKQTEVGLIPEDWNVYRFEDLGDTIIGLTYKPVDVNITGKLVHRSSNIQNNKLAYHDNVYVTCHVPEKLILRKDDILICVRNGSRDLIGKSAIIQGISIGETFGAFMSVFRPRIYPPLVYQYFISNIVQSQINASLGATINQITNKTLNSFITVFPTNLSEQKAIATALSDVDELIANLDKLITKKKAIKQGAMQQLLTPPHKGGKRLEGFTGEWEEKKLGDVGEIITGSTPSTYNKTYWDGIIPWVTPTDIKENKNIFSSERSISEKGLKVIRKLPKNSLLVTCIASIGKNAILRKDGSCNQQINAVVPNEKHNVDFLYYLIEINNNIILSKAGITATLMVSKKVFSDISLYFPPTKVEQDKISQILSDMDYEIEQLKDKKSKYQSIKQGMMQELLTGKTRLL